jgi:hypothetical protein
MNLLVQLQAGNFLSISVKKDSAPCS